MNAIFYPMFAQVLLTFTVWACLVIYRVVTLARKRVHPQVLANEARAAEIYKTGTNLSDNFENLFEVPVLFYAATLTLAHLGIHDPVAVTLGWGFVGLRAAHSIVHSFWNNIGLRFALYLVSTLCVLGIWARIAQALLF